jgi:hypothetical protein
VMDKPGGIPAHPTVDNGTENVLYVAQQLPAQQQHHHTQHDDHRHHQGAGDGCCDTKETAPLTAVPYRLDIETSGLILVGTQAFVSYMGKLLEDKTLQHTTGGGGDVGDDTPPGNHQRGIQKRYRCLVCFSHPGQHRNLRGLQADGTIVTHYTDKSSNVPKLFVPDRPAVQHKDSCCTGSATTTTTTTIPASDTIPVWLECKLRLVDVGPLIPLEHNQEDDISIRGRSTDDPSTTPSPAMSLGGALWTWPFRRPSGTNFVAQVTVDLLTGRTHQIRGQLSLLGCPIVGDVLYGGASYQHGDGRTDGARPVQGVSPDARFGDTNYVRLALQCYNIAFPKPRWGWVTSDPAAGRSSKRPAPPRRLLVPSADGEQHEFSLESAWWTPLVADAAASDADRDGPETSNCHPTSAEYTN